MALVSRPLERRWSETERSGVTAAGWPEGRAKQVTNPGAAGAGCKGQDFLVPFGGAGHPGDCQKGLAQQGETKLSDSSTRANESENFIRKYPILPVRYQSLLPPRKRDKPLLTPQIANGLSAFLVERLIHIQRWPRMPWLADLACRIPDHRGM